MSTAARNKRLDALETAVDDWASKEEKRLKAEEKFLKVVKNSGGASAAAQNLTDVKGLMVGNINQFLTG